MSALYLSRIRLRRDAPVAALAGLLLPDAADARIAASHSLVWSLFADTPDRRRDFLWRQEAPGRFLTLSARLPVNAAGLFSVESKPFEPDLATGDRLEFSLRANAVISRSTGPGQRGRRHDVVMDALRATPPGEARAQARAEAVVAAGRAWLARQGAEAGFEPFAGVAVDGYEKCRLPRRFGPPATFGVLDFDGQLTVTDAERFLARLTSGFGRARGFGCGLMLIRRARSAAP